MIRLLILDVDGTLTDGGIYYDSTGNELKKFCAKDGAGLMIARAAGIRVMICTGRECEAVRRRAADLKITDVYQNVRRKADFLADFFAKEGYRREEAAYCGDDVNDRGLPGRRFRPDPGAGGLYLPPAGRRGGRARAGAEDPAGRRPLEGRRAGGLRRDTGLNRRGLVCRAYPN